MFRKISMAALAVVFALVFTGCGTLFRGDRVGKRSSNQIDPAILILDCCGFLFGIIPGVVALVLDINNKPSTTPLPKPPCPAIAILPG